jgi:hypothetical protein
MRSPTTQQNARTVEVLATPGGRAQNILMLCWWKWDLVQLFGKETRYRY